MSQSYFVAYAPEALRDLRAIYAYIAFRLQERTTAERQIGRIRREIRGLKTMPERYVTVDWEPWAAMGMRKMTVGHYVVFYLVDGPNQAVTVVRILYGGRDLENMVKGE